VATAGRVAAGYVIRHHAIGDFCVARDGRSVRAVPLPSASASAIEDAFVGFILPLVLNLRGVNGLHASAVRVGDEAVAFSGISGAGKSTTVAYLQSLGYPVLTDEYLGLNDTGRDIVALPGLSRVRVWPDSLAALQRLDPLSCNPRATPNGRAKSTIAVTSRGAAFEASTLPLTRIYYLPPRDATGPAASPPPPGVRIERLAGRDAFTEILQQMYRLDVRDPKMLKGQADLLTRLSAERRIKRLVVGGFESLCDLPGAIQADLAESRTGAS
jgi:hypothetical protein